jgi:ABC-type Fe3+ transport system permease subunit
MPTVIVPGVGRLRPIRGFAMNRWMDLLGLAVLSAPMLWPVVHGLGGALVVLWQGVELAGGGELWPSKRVWFLLGHSLLLSLSSAALATFIAAICAGAMLLPMPRLTRLLLVACWVACFCLGTVVHMLAWRALFPGVSGGAQGLAMAVVTMTMRYAPLAVALLSAGLAALERVELETALCTGGGHALWVVARTRLLRLSGMCMAAIASLVFCESEVPALWGVQVYAEEFLSQVALEPDARIAAALGWPLMTVAAGCAAWMSRLPRLKANSAEAVQLGWIGQWGQLSTWQKAVWLGSVCFLAALPLMLLAWGGLQASGRWPAQAGSALLASLGVAAVSALVAVAWGWVLAASAVRCGARAVKTTNLLLWLAMLWPSALTGIAMAGWDLPPWAGAATPLVIAHAMRLLPFAAWALLALLDAHGHGPYDQLSLLKGRSTWRYSALRHVHWPMLRPGLLAAFILCVGLSMAELTITVLTVPPGMETVILRLYNLLHYGDQRGVMMLALAQGLMVAVLAAIGLGVLWGLAGTSRAITADSATGRRLAGA